MKLPKIDMKSVCHHYPETTMFGAVRLSAERFPEAPAYDFMDKITTYEEFISKIELAAKAFLDCGICADDAVTICMPNTPQAIICLYALNRIGAVANMVHPLSSQKNITFYLDFSKSKMILTLDQFYVKVKKACEESNSRAKIIVARIQDELPSVKSFLYKNLKNKENLKYPDDRSDLTWHDFIKKGSGISLPEIKYDKNKTAVILYSGGTSGTPKGIQLTDFNFNALGMQIAEICGCNLTYGCKFLSVMPIFHGFGLGIGIHTILENGAMCILIPQFTKETYAEAVKKKKPNFIAGVPTLFEALLRVDSFKDADLSFLIGVFSGGDALNPELKKKVDAFFKEHNANLQIREGYGLTECVTCSCVTPVHKSKTGSIGVPLRDTEYKIVEPGTFTELPVGEKGEIIISGPTLMTGYMNNEEETANTLRTDKDGKIWLFTGDLGSKDDEGFIYFHQRIKRMIITSGYNVFPSHIERILDKHPDIDCSCVIGMPDPYKMQKIRAYISLKPGKAETEEEKQKILGYCSDYLDVYEMPQEIIFRQELPKTLVGKVAYHTLEEEAVAEADVLFETIKELLGIDNLDLSDSFFNLGGNSLKALELKDKLEEKGFDIRLSNIFDSSDIHSIKKSISETKKIDRNAEYSSAVRITYAQQRVYSAQMLSPESTMYNITFAFKADNVNPRKLENAVNLLIKRHESLRTHFENRNGEIMQVIDEFAEISLEKLHNEDISSFVRPFDLSVSPLIRVGYYGNTVVFDMHHIISDGGTLPVFFRELNEAYMGRKLPETVQYGEFAVTEQYSEENEKYWLSVYNDELPLLELPSDMARTDKQSFNGSVIYDIVNIDFHRRITEKCNELNITPYVFYVTCYNILLSKFSGCEDIIVGIPVTGRSGHFLNTVGMFVNTVAFRNKPEGAKSVGDFLREVKANSVAVIDNQNYPFGELVKKLNIDTVGRNPLFDVMFAYQREEMTDVIFGDKKAELLPVPILSSKCDFNFNIMPGGDNVVIMVEYCTDLYKEKTILRFVNAYKSILEQCLDTEKIIKDISVADIGLTSDFNATDHKYDIPDNSTLYSIFDKAAKENSEKICIKTAEREISFGEFLAVAEKTDRKIRDITGNKKSVIAVITERSPEMYGAIYGVIRGGNAYLPIDPEYPQERIEYILENSNASAVAVQGKFAGLVKNLPCVDMTEILYSSEEEKENIPFCSATPEDTAYVIYTSGSTGNPKGAKISHKSALNRILWMHDRYPLGNNDVILQKTPYTFDVSVWEHFWWGLTGGCLAVSKPGEHFIPAKILEETHKNSVTHLHFVPSVFELFLNYLDAHRDELYKFDSVKYVFLSGEVLSASLVQRFYKLYDSKKVTLHNLYGPTECAVDVTCYDCRPEDVDPVPIGKPVYNTQIYITDKYLNPVPVGVKGEICIAGMNVGQGYLNKPELTAEKFVDNPFGEGKLYKTGDIGYWRDDGNLVFAGRKDSQIKLNGQRIELGEIEAVINEITGVTSSAVIVKNVNGADILAAFFTGEADVSYIKDVCSVRLPSYMIPGAIIHLDKLPLNLSGKLDRKALSEMDIELSPEGEFAEPENETEKLICEMFSRVLDVKNVGRNSDFFTIGGTSLSMISILNEDIFENITAAEFIRNSTPAKLSRILGKSEEKKLEYLELLHKSDNSEKVLILFPYAGGGAEAFSKLVSDFIQKNKDVSVYFVPYLHTSEECKKAAREIADTLSGKDIFVYSHCVGASVALQIIKILEDRNVPVKHYLAGALIPPSKPRGKNIWNKVSDSMLKAILMKAGAPLELLSENEITDILRRFREDTDFANISFAGIRGEISTPVSVLISKRDLFTKNHRQTERLWNRYAKKLAGIHFIDSKDHYFQSSSPEKIIEILENSM